MKIKNDPELLAEENRKRRARYTLQKELREKEKDEQSRSLYQNKELETCQTKAGEENFR